jgi:hypothetical protein
MVWSNDQVPTGFKSASEEQFEVVPCTSTCTLRTPTYLSVHLKGLPVAFVRILYVDPGRSGMRVGQHERLLDFDHHFNVNSPSPASGLITAAERNISSEGLRKNGQGMGA